MRSFQVAFTFFLASVVLPVVLWLGHPDRPGFAVVVAVVSLSIFCLVQVAKRISLFMPGVGAIVLLCGLVVIYVVFVTVLLHSRHEGISKAEIDELLRKAEATRREGEASMKEINEILRRAEERLPRAREGRPAEAGERQGRTSPAPATSQEQGAQQRPVGNDGNQP